MAGVVGSRRFGWLVLLFVVVGVIAGCGSDGEVSAPSSSTSTTASAENTEPADLEVDEFGIVETSAITAAFLPEITENDIEIIEGDAGTSYRYVFPTGDLADGVTVDLEARWEPVDGGLQPSLEWNLTGGDSSPSDFAFTVSLPKSFAESVDDIDFDPQPTEIIDPDPEVRWQLNIESAPRISAMSSRLIRASDPSDAVRMVMDALNAIQIHRELSACEGRFRSTQTVAQCYLNVVAINARWFDYVSCDALDRAIGRAYRDYPGFSLACETVVGLAKTGATSQCSSGRSPEEIQGCQDAMWMLFAGSCPLGEGLDRQICLYDAAVAVGDEWWCIHLGNLGMGNPEMANDCRAAITKDPSYCAKTEDPDLRASCCENFRGTEDYDTCLGSTGEDATGESTTTTVDEETTTTATEETTTTEPTEEDPPPAIPAGTYTGSFDEVLLIDLLAYDFGKPEINTITVTVDDEGIISGEFAVHQEGVFLGCPGAVDDWTGIVDSGQQIGPELPQIVNVTVSSSGFQSFEAVGFGPGAAHCLVPPVPYSDGGLLAMSFDRVVDGLLTGDADDYMPFELQLVP
ncbi:MAG: hypothetical protein U9N79_08680 [Actinomycetota bacterium]|nr:hypothetical protein [Actinomycetota bacterium]